MKQNRTTWLLIAGLSFTVSPFVQAQDSDTAEIVRQLQRRIEELEQKVKNLETLRTNGVGSGNVSNEKIEALDQKVKGLERKREIEQEINAENAKTVPTVSLGANGLIVRSADTNFLMNVHGYAQADARFYMNEHNPANDTFLLRRVRPIIEGTVYDRFDYRFMADFGSGNVTGSTPGNNALLDDAYLNARIWPDLQVQAGKFKSPVGLERLQSTAELLFLETGFATQLTPNYDVGVEVHNNLFNEQINYAIGVFNGAIDAASSDVDTTDEGKDIAGRIFFQPFLRTDYEALNQLGFGFGGSLGHHEGPLPSYKTPGQQTFFSYASTVSAAGDQHRLDPQFFYYWGPFGLLGEYIISSQKVKATSAKTTQRFDNSAWQVEATYFLTGDHNSFRSSSRNSFRPAHPFSFDNGGWGAFEFVARIGRLSLDRAAFPVYASSGSAREATSWGVGLNWYLNSNVRFYFDFESTHFDGGSKAPSALTARDERALLGRVQFSF
ncbi:MAG TPA: porin [Verrucomicrobiae bacterium]|nr:porin [Verrucomicrobiae bacterium]